jgi:methyltransferase (TIGR00027 family)
VQPGRPSLTADHVARRRALHQLIDDPVVFPDPVALKILEPADAASLQANPRRASGPIQNIIRATVVARSRFAEDELAVAVARGVRQYVVLGAGLDTFAYRNPHPALRVFEVDYPSTQVWKRARLTEGGIAIPPSLTFVPVDFLEQSIEGGLRTAGFRVDVPTFFSWLGVTMFLTRDAVMSTLSFVAHTRGSAIVFDYTLPPPRWNLLHRLVFAWQARIAAAAGEPFRGAFQPASLTRDMAALGFSQVEDVAPGTLNARYFSAGTSRLRVPWIVHFIKAMV